MAVTPEQIDCAILTALHEAAQLTPGDSLTPIRERLVHFVNRVIAEEHKAYIPYMRVRKTMAMIPQEHFWRGFDIGFSWGAGFVIIVQLVIFLVTQWIKP